MRAVCGVLLAVLAACAFGCSAHKQPQDETTTPVAVEEPTATAPLGDRPLDSVTLIERDVSAGLIDYSTGILYKVYAMFDPMNLPAEYESDVPIKCGTPLIMEVQRNWHRILPEHRSEIETYITPIAEPGEPDTELDDVTPDRLEHERNRLD